MQQVAKNNFDLVIIGAGPAGLTAAIYASRANLKVTFVEKGAPGGKMVYTNKIENWTGDVIIDGPDLALRMFDHAQKYTAQYKYGEVVAIETSGEFKHAVVLKSGEVLNAKSVIIASGMIEKVPHQVENIVKFNNKGVSYCAICDGPIFKGQAMAVIGDGNSAVEEGTYLASIAKKVYLFSILPTLTAEKRLVKELLSKPNVEIFYEAQITKLHGETTLAKISTQIKGVARDFDVKAVFPYIGQLPQTRFVEKLGITNQAGFIQCDQKMETKIQGIYAIGDVRAKNIRQITTAASDGTIAAKVITNKIG